MAEGQVEEPISEMQAIVNRRNEEREQSAADANTQSPKNEPIENSEVNKEPVTPEVVEPIAEVKNYEGYISPSDFEAKQKEWQEQNKVSQPEYSERTKKLIELDKQGIDLTEKVIKYSNTDFDAVDLKDVNNSLNVIKQALMDIKNRSEDEAEALMERDYPNLYRDIEDGDDSFDKAIDTESILVGIEAKDALVSLKEYQAKVMLPPKAEVQASNEPTAEQIEAQKQSFEAYTASASSALESFKSYDINLGEDVKISVPATQENMGDVRALVADPQKQSTYFADNYLKDGEVDFEKFISDQFKLKNFDAIMKEVGLQHAAMGKDEVLSETNLSPKLGKTVPSSGSIELSNVEKWKLAQAGN